jgi:hypothetical protein
MTSPGRRFAAAIAERDRGALLAALGDEVDFKALTPGRFWEAETASDVDGIVFGHWFEETDRVTSVVHVDEDRIGDTTRVGYRFDLECPDGPKIVEQQAYYRALDERIIHLRIVCSGFRAR